MPQYRLSDIVEGVVSGECLNGEPRLRRDGEKAVLKVSAVTYGYFKEDEYKVIQETSKSKKNVTPCKGDLLFSRANTREYVGATALVQRDYPSLLLPDKLWKIIPGPMVTTLFLKSYLSSDEIRKNISAMASGTSVSMYNVSMEKLQNLVVYVPSIAAQKQYAAFT